jgi:hypothetical protein
VGKEAISLGNIFMFRESEKNSKKTPGVSFSIYPCGYEKEIKFYPVAFSCIYKHEKEQRLSSVCPQLENWGINSKMIIKDWKYSLQDSIHSPTLILSPISLLDGKNDKGG